MGDGAGRTLAWDQMSKAQQAQALGMFDMHEGALSLHHYVIGEDGNVVSRVRDPALPRAAGAA